MPLSGSRQAQQLLSRPARRRARRLRLAVLVSLLIHVVIGILLLVTIRRTQEPELLPPPSAVTMLFESGRKNGPTLPNPELQATPSAPAAENPPPIPPSPWVPQQSAATKPSPPLPVPDQLSPPPVEVPPVPLPPVPAPVPPAPPKEPPLISPPLLKVQPLPVPQPPAVRQPSRQLAPPKTADFPAPMNFSLGKPLSPSSSASRPRPMPHIPGTIDMSLGPASQGAADATPRADQGREAEGADWRNALSRWVAEHAYYPDQARREAQEGDAQVHVIVEPNGTVKMVELVRRSGSMWLDLALLALFRDQHIPPLPLGTADPVDFNFTMHYVLIRSR